MIMSMQKTSVRMARSTTVCSASSNASRVVVPTAHRRAAMLTMVSGMTMVASPAFALIPDDDDEEMVQQARANRKKRLAGEKQAEKEFSRSEGFVDKNSKKSLAIVQLAVNALAKVGAALASGAIGEASAASREIDASKLGAALKALSLNASASSAGDAAAAELGALLTALNMGDLAASKKEFVDTTVALTDFVIKANVTGLKGI